MINQEYFNKVKKYFKGDEKKTWQWFQTVNPLFGMMTPLALIKLGKASKVEKIIDDRLNGIHP